MDILRLATFCDAGEGGNPAGVVLAETMPADAEMQSLAAEVNYSETAFAIPTRSGWRVRYFAPQAEVAFCGHATIALGAALARRHGNGVFALILNDTRITVEGYWGAEGECGASLQSPASSSAPPPPALRDAALELFSLHESDLQPSLPPLLARAGARHLLIGLRSRATLAKMRYDMRAGQALMRAANIDTIMLAFAETPVRFHARNAFAAGGVYEDPATGAAAAAFAGALRDLDWPHRGGIEIVQGEDMGMRSLIHAQIPQRSGGSIRVSGAARLIAERSD